MKAPFLVIIGVATLLLSSLPSHATTPFLENQAIESDIADYLEETTGINRTCMYSTQITNLPVTITQSGYYCLNNNLNLTTGTFSNASNAAGQQISPSIGQTVINALGQAAILNQAGVATITPQPTASLVNQTVGQNFSTFSSSSAAITINVPSTGPATAGNVILDLNNLEIASTRRNNIGIYIIGQTNVIIRNGRIRNFTQGISISNAGSGSSNIIIDSIIFTRNSTGISISGGENYFMNNCRIIQSTGNGVSLSQVTNCHFTDCTSTDNDLSGYLINNGQTVRFINCVGYNNSQAGFYLQAISNGLLYQCTANFNNTGFSITNNGSLISDSISVNNCAAENNTAEGCIINGNGVVMQNCQFLSNLTGLSVFGTGHTILECIANYNTQYGINLHSNSLNCQVRNNTTTGNKYGLATSGTNNRIYTNFANDNSTNNFVGITNVATSPTATTAINFTANIAE